MNKDSTRTQVPLVLRWLTRGHVSRCTIAHIHTPSHTTHADSQTNVPHRLCQGALTDSDICWHCYELAFKDEF